MTTTQDPRIDAIAKVKAHASMGTDNYYHISELHPKRFMVTLGVKELCNAAECHWLIDAIASHQRTIWQHQKITEGHRQWWELTVYEDESARLVCLADDEETELINQEIEYTDYPLTREKIWVMPGSTEKDGPLAVCMLPAEY